jgi:alpha-beta hydrolase superfamily lysophospholipase
LFLYGQHDQVIPAGAIRAAMRKMPPHFTFVHYQQGWHMLLRDLQAQRVWQDVAAWVSNPAAPLPSGETVTPEGFLKQKQWSAAQKSGK